MYIIWTFKHVFFHHNQRAFHFQIFTSGVNTEKVEAVKERTSGSVSFDKIVTYVHVHVLLIKGT